MRILKAGDVKRWNAWMENIEGLSLYKQRAALEKMLRSMYRTFDPKDPYAEMLIETTEQTLISVAQQIQGGTESMKKIALFRDNFITDLERDVNDFLAELQKSGISKIEVHLSSSDHDLVTVMVVWDE